MNRRGFLARLVAAPIVALSVLRTPINHDWLNELRSFQPEAPLGISIRFIKQFDVSAAHDVTRFDVLYGAANLAPEFAVRITDDLPWWSPRRWFS